MKKILFLCLGIASLLIGLPSSAEKAEKPTPLIVTFFVDTAQAVSPEGFVEESDKWLQDSVRDITKILNGKNFKPKKGFPGSFQQYVLVTDRKAADIVLTVAARGTSSVTLGQRTTSEAYKGVVTADTVPTMGVTRWVSIILSVDTYKKEMVAWSTSKSRFSMGAWTDDAKYLALGSVSWVMANEQKIRERKAQRRVGE